MSPPSTYQCPFCGGEVTVGSSCPGCNPNPTGKPPPPANRKSWQQDEVHDGLELPAEDFDYDEFVAREFGRSPHLRLRVKWYWWALGLGFVGLLIFLIGTNRW